MSEQLGNRPDIAATVNGEARKNLVQVLGELTLREATSAAQASVMTAQLQRAEENYNLLAGEVETLRAQMDGARDLSKLDFTTLETELKHRGYEVNASGTGRVRSEPVE
jgi:hypothetical protein